jgi:hypothetical protein
MDDVAYSSHELWSAIKRHCNRCMSRNQGYKYCTDTACEFAKIMKAPRQITLFDGAMKEAWLRDTMHFIIENRFDNFTTANVRTAMQQSGIGGAGHSSWWTKPLAARLKKAGYFVSGTTKSTVESRNGAVVCVWRKGGVREPLRQTAQPCPQCGSFYRRGGRCIVCGARRL